MTLQRGTAYSVRTDETGILTKFASRKHPLKWPLTIPVQRAVILADWQCPEEPRRCVSKSGCTNYFLVPRHDLEDILSYVTWC
jgi:hypothetical protein